jgi:hypothetical protein
MAAEEMTTVAAAPADARRSAAALYPVLLDLAGWECAVLGGGPMAEAKVRGLMEAGARVTVIAQELTPELKALAEQGRIGWERRKPAALGPRRVPAGDLRAGGPRGQCGVRGRGGGAGGLVQCGR